MTIGGITMKKVMQAGQFKAQCLKVMDEVKITGQELVITKHHVPIVRLCPIKKNEKSLFGRMKGTVHIHGDITQSIDEIWDADR